MLLDCLEPQKKRGCKCVLAAPSSNLKVLQEQQTHHYHPTSVVACLEKYSASLTGATQNDKGKSGTWSGVITVLVALAGHNRLIHVLCEAHPEKLSLPLKFSKVQVTGIFENRSNSVSSVI